MRNKRSCTLENYHLAMMQLSQQLSTTDFDCIVALKRSGWILGAYLSNQLEKPVFSCSEIDSIPEKFKNILIVDDKIFYGKSIRQVEHKLHKRGKKTMSAVLYVQDVLKPDFYVHCVTGKLKMWYERRQTSSKI